MCDPITRLNEAVNHGRLAKVRDGVFYIEDVLGGNVEITIADIRAVLGVIQAKDNEITEEIETGLALRHICVEADAEVKRLRSALEAVHKDLVDRAAPDGTVAVGASVWIGLDEAVKGGA